MGSSLMALGLVLVLISLVFIVLSALPQWYLNRQDEKDLKEARLRRAVAEAEEAEQKALNAQLYQRPTDKN